MSRQKSSSRLAGIFGSFTPDPNHSDTWKVRRNMATVCLLFGLVIYPAFYIFFESVRELSSTIYILIDGQIALYGAGNLIEDRDKRKSAIQPTA